MRHKKSKKEISRYKKNKHTFTNFTGIIVLILLDNSYKEEKVNEVYYREYGKKVCNE